VNKIRNLIPVLLGPIALAALVVACSGPATVHGDVPTQMPTLQLTNTDTPVPTSRPTEVATPTPIPATAEAPAPVSTVTPHPTLEWTAHEDELYTIVFQRCGELWLSEVSGQEERPLTNEDMGTSERPCLGVGAFAVSPDGQSIAYIVRAEDNNDFVKVVDILDGSTRVVGSTSEPYSVFIFQQPAWWNDAHIAYYVSEPPPTKENDTTTKKHLVVEVPSPNPGLWLCASDF
jgi:hypothetical protein